MKDNPKCCKCNDPAEYNLPSNLCTFHFDCWFYMKLFTLEEEKKVDKLLDKWSGSVRRFTHEYIGWSWEKYCMWRHHPWTKVQWTAEELEALNEWDEGEAQREKEEGEQETQEHEQEKG